MDWCKYMIWASYLLGKYGKKLWVHIFKKLSMNLSDNMNSKIKHSSSAESNKILQMHLYY